MSCGLSRDAQILWKKPIEKEWTERVAELYRSKAKPDPKRRYEIEQCKAHGYDKTLKFLLSLEK